MVERAEAKTEESRRAISKPSESTTASYRARWTRAKILTWQSVQAGHPFRGMQVAKMHEEEFFFEEMKG